MTLPGAIIIAGAIIALSIIYVKKPASNPNIAGNSDTTYDNSVDINLAPINGDDHILGNPSAELKIVEYSDPSCPYCKVFNSTMTDVMDQYGPKGKVAWVYRSYPLDAPDGNGNVLHPNAGRESQAMECAATLGGNEKFWAYEKQLYTVTPSVTSKTPDGLDQKQLPIIAKAVGLDPVAFNECLADGRTKDKVAADFLSGNNAGVSGTPTSFFLLGDKVSSTATTYVANALVQYRIPPDLLYFSKDRKIIFVSGALPKALIAGLIDSLTKN